MVIFIFIKHAGEHKVEKVCFETCGAIIVSWVLINTPITPPEMFLRSFLFRGAVKSLTYCNC